MKLPIQVEALVYRCFFNAYAEGQPENVNVEVLALHRVPARGGFWQPLTGGMEVSDADGRAAVVREVGEELHLFGAEIVRVDQLDYEFQFLGDKGVTLTERAYGVEIASSADIKLSDEHDEMRWGRPEEIRGLYKWAENRQALDVLLESLRRFN